MNKRKEPEDEIRYEEAFNKDAISENGLPKNIKKPPKGRRPRVYMDGIFDLFHFGHARALEQAKRIFPDCYLIAGVCNDEVTHSMKGKTVMNERERAESLRHCKWVDEIIENAPWIIDQEFLDEHQIDYVAHDDIPYQSGDYEDVYGFCKKSGRFIPTRRTHGVSTSELITRIVRDYDSYVRRNLERGVSRKDLNVSFFKVKRLQMKQNVAKLTEKIAETIHKGEESIRHNLNETNEYWKETFHYWEHTSHELIRGFAGLFQPMFNREMLHQYVSSPIDRSPSSSPNKRQKLESEESSA